MTNVAAAAPVAEGEFRVGRVFSRTTSILSRNFLTFFVVTAVAALPNVLISQSVARQGTSAATGWLVFGGILAIALSMLSQAIVLYGAFQDMRGRPVNLVESLRVGFGRLLAILGLAICVSFGVGFGLMLLLVPGFILMTMWFVATPACVVEQLGPFASMGRSRALTKGHRWKIFGMMLLVLFAGGIVSAVVGAILGLTGSTVVVTLGTLIWNGVWGAFYAIFVVVTYHDLRVAKEGIDIHQIAAVFD
jgi:MFS family permease